MDQRCSRFRYWLVKGSLSDKAACWDRLNFSFKGENNVTDGVVNDQIMARADVWWCCRGKTLRAELPTDWKGTCAVVVINANTHFTIWHKTLEKVTTHNTPITKSNVPAGSLKMKILVSLILWQDGFRTFSVGLRELLKRLIDTAVTKTTMLYERVPTTDDQREDYETMSTRKCYIWYDRWWFIW